MPLGTESSMVADSTTTSSPVLSDAPEAIRRPVRTYGRRREEPLAEDPDSSIFYPELRSTLRDTIHNTAPPGLKEKIPSSSPPERRNPTFEDDSDQETQPDTLPTFEFGWKERLKQIDTEDDFEEAVLITGASKVDGPKQSLFGGALLLQVPKDDATISNLTDSHAFISEYEDVFGGPPSSTAFPSSPLQEPSAKPTFNLSSPAILQRSRSRKTKVVRDLDSEEELPKDSSSTAASTSSRPAISHSRSPSTQPTSDDEMPAKVTTTKARPTVSRKSSTSSRPSIPPLDFAELPPSNAKKSKKDKKTKVKGPTKKEVTEMVKERYRLSAQAAIAIPRSMTESKYTMNNLLRKVQGQVPADPIEPFSSSPPKRMPMSPERRFELPASSPLRPETPDAQSHLPGPADSDDDIPEVQDLLRHNTKKRKNEELKEQKQRALLLQSKLTITPDEDDDDLEIVHADPKAAVKDEHEQRRSGQKLRISAAVKVATQYGQVNLAKHAKKSAMLSPIRSRRYLNSVIVQHASFTGSSADLNRLMLAQAQDEARRETQRKAEEWRKHGGHTGVNMVAPAQDLPSRAAEILKARVAKMDVDGDDDGEEDTSDEDGEWDADLRGSASPEPEEEEIPNDENTPTDEDTTMVAEVDEVEDEDLKVRVVLRNIVDSDSEEDEEKDENAPIKPTTTVKYRRSSTTSELQTEDEQDKENNTKLMYDESEDKENTKIVRHTPLSAAAPVSIFGLHSIRSSTSSPEVQPHSWPRGEDLNLDDEPSTEKRRPFKELISEESPRSSTPQLTSLTQSFASKLQQASPLPSTLTPTPTLKAFLIGEGSSKSLGGFSRFSDGEADVFGAAPLQPGFSDLFESGTERPKPSGIVGKHCLELGADYPSDEGESDKNENKPSRKLQRSDTLDLTQDVSALIHLQPAFQAETALRNKADAIFEKEQAFVVEANTRKPTRQDTELYVNDLGFLTQTKPLNGTPEVYRRSPAQSSYGSMLSPSQIGNLTQNQSRAPLRTISLSSSTQFDSPEQPKTLRRLRKHDDTPPRSVASITPPLVQPKRNAFTELERAQAKEEKKRKLKEMGGFFEDEAAESDDDDMFGFVKPKRDGDDEDGEDLDKTLDVLMDDREMDEETEAAQLVLDKYNEQQEEEDKKLEAIARAAAEGDLRKKRSRGIGVDDSDDDGDEDENERVRRAMKKARKSDRGDIKDLEADENTRPFADAYNLTLRDDDENDFGHLAHDSQVADIVADRGSDDEEAEEAQETVDSREIAKIVRERLKEGAIAQMDVKDISWIDRDEDMEDAPRIRTVSKRPQIQQDMEVSELDGTMGAAFRKTTAIQLTKSNKDWFAQENKSRAGGTARSVGGSAITGHAKAKPKNGVAGSSRKGVPSVPSSSSLTGRKPPPKAPSMLSVISDKSVHFKH